MLCEQCRQNEAVLFIQESDGDTTSTIQLCKQCAAEIGIYQEGQIHLDPEQLLNLDAFKSNEESSDWLDNFLVNDDDEIIETEEDVETIKCDNCGLTADELASSDTLVRMGCPECYKVFASMLNPLLEKIHYGTTHRSSREGDHSSPSAIAGKTVNKRYIRDLEEEMARAVVAENYEEAANIRDQIKEHNNKNAGR